MIAAIVFASNFHSDFLNHHHWGLHGSLDKKEYSDALWVFYSAFQVRDNQHSFEQID
jgi:hypothetical protein